MSLILVAFGLYIPWFGLVLRFLITTSQSRRIVIRFLMSYPRNWNLCPCRNTEKKTTRNEGGFLAPALKLTVIEVFHAYPTQVSPLHTTSKPKGLFLTKEIFQKIWKTLSFRELRSGPFNRKLQEK